MASSVCVCVYECAAVERAGGPRAEEADVPAGRLTRPPASPVEVIDRSTSAALGTASWPEQPSHGPPKSDRELDPADLSSRHRTVGLLRTENRHRPAPRDSGLSEGRRCKAQTRR